MRFTTLTTRAIAVFAAAAIVAGTMLTLDRRGRPHPSPESSTDVASEMLSVDAAIAFWSARVTRDPADYLSRTQLASQYLRRGREKHSVPDALTADKEVNRALFVNPNDLAALRTKASAHMFVHDFSGARMLAARVLQIDATDSGALAISGDAAFELGDLAEANRVFQGLAVRLGHAPEIDSRLSRVAHAEGHDDEAMQLVLQAQRAAADADYPVTDRAYYDVLIAEYSRAAGRYDDAGAAYERAVSARPTDNGSIEGLARVRASQGRLADAEALWKRSGRLIGTPDFHVLSALGDIEFARGNEVRAQQFWHRALAAVDKLHGQERVGFLRDESRFRASHHLDPKVSVFLAAADLGVRHDAYAYDTLAWAKLANGDVKGAQQAIKTALATGLRDAGLWYHAAKIREAAGDRTGARAFIDRALAQNPHFDLYESIDARALRDRVS
jgi:tetratricopeptide (TPR) repeat protein